MISITKYVEEQGGADPRRLVPPGQVPPEEKKSYWQQLGGKVKAAGKGAIQVADTARQVVTPIALYGNVPWRNKFMVGSAALNMAKQFMS